MKNQTLENILYNQCVKKFYGNFEAACWKNNKYKSQPLKSGQVYLFVMKTA